ncbi:hypothetical protein ACUM5Y_01125 [Marinomonas dokdonensis]|uniref:hypothetical protein n=1 Tax=Marinomonas dokdonensis TaxID=328224 RepID=UPI0040557858
MKNSKSLVELLDSADITYISETEKYTAIANAERAEYIVEVVASATQSVKNFFAKIKANLNPRTMKHA